jgi:amino-acid N-acetyltransferase
MNHALEARVAIRPAAASDVDAIDTILRANRRDRSLFQQPRDQIRRTLADFVVAADERGDVIGCTALHRHDGAWGEILAVAVDPAAHGRGVGAALVRAAVRRARQAGLPRVWLGTAKPAYFARFGFRPISRWALPLSVLGRKLLLVLQQPPSRWLPAIFGRHRFMAMALAGHHPRPETMIDLRGGDQRL